MKQVFSSLVNLVIILCGVSGCGRSQSGPVEKPNQVVASDPVAELKQAIELFQAKSKATNYSFDVKKTDSLVSPYIGTVKYEYSAVYKENIYVAIFTASFAYQDNKWTLTSVDEPDGRGLFDPNRKEDPSMWEAALSAKYSK